MAVAENILSEGTKFDFFLSLKISDDAITLLNDQIPLTPSDRVRTRGVARTAKQREEPFANQSQRTIQTSNGVRVLVAVSQKENGKIEINAEAHRGDENIEVKYSSTNGEYLGTNQVEIPPTMRYVLLSLLDPQAPHSSCACGGLAIQRNGYSAQFSAPEEELDEYGQITITDEAWNLYSTGRIRWEEPLPGMICSDCSPMKKVVKHIEFAAKSVRPALALGESGTGKELVAKALHNCRNRKGACVTFNCSELTAGDPMLVLGKLFGYGLGHGIQNVPKEGQTGMLMDADGGTLFFDEIADLPLETQTNLLRVMDGYEFGPAIGKGKTQHTDARFVGATNKNLELEMKNGRFRGDFLGRWKMLSIELPPLRQRLRDIPALVEYFTKKDGTVRFAEDLFKALFWYHWPGNVRELESLCQSILKEALPEVQALDLKKFADLPLDKRMKEELRHAYKKYQDAVERSEIGAIEKQIINRLVEISTTLFPSALEALRNKDEQEWLEAMATAQKEFKQFLLQMKTDKANSLIEQTSCFDLMMACYPDKKHLPKRMLQLILEQLKHGKIILSSQREKYPYETFEKFFGRNHDAIRK